MKRVLLVVAALALASLVLAACGGGDEETTAGATGATGPAGEAGESAELGKATYTVADVRASGGSVKVALAIEGTGVIVDPDHPLSVTLVGGDGERYKGQVGLGTSGAMTADFDVPPDAQSGATLELEQDGETATLDLGL